jgi:hypothetical protein
MACIKNIKIVAVPPESKHVCAPQWVREQWVGIILPVAEGAPSIICGVGALGGKSESDKRYVVKTAEALQKLEEKSPEAARWWRNRFCTDGPHSLRWLVFPKTVCELIPN